MPVNPQSGLRTARLECSSGGMPQQEAERTNGMVNVFEDLAGQVAVITGGARGLGLSMAQALGKWRVKIALLDILAEVKDSAETVQRDLEVESLGVVADVTDDRSVASAFAEVGRTLGSPSILVNAAGITVWEDSIDASKESWQRVIDINLTGTFLCCQALARACRAADKGGVIVNVSSMSAQIVNVPQHQASYNVSKAGVDMLTKSLAVEWAPLGIRVNAIAPGYMLSEMTRQFTAANPELAERWRNMIPAGRMGEPADLEALVVFLCSARSSYLMGQSVVIDGAYTAV
jgi:NAD(P)-dependent dehydrogenase (short-subunit alcohol dehydrogenase family)